MRRIAFVWVLMTTLLLALPSLAQNVAFSQPPLTTGNITTNASIVCAPIAGMGSASITVHGTHAGINASFELSDDATSCSSGTWYPTTCSRSDVTLWQSTTGVITSNASQMWDCAAWGSLYIRIRSTAYTSGTGVVNISPSGAPIEPALTVGIDPSSDPCASPSAVKQTASVAFSSATTTAVVAAVANKKIYVCSVFFTMSSGTTPTIVFKAGTGGTCGAATVTFTGILALPTASGSVVQFGGAYTLFGGAASSEFCYTTAGTTPTGNGFVTYVQQ